MIQPMDRYNQPHPGMMTRPHNASPRNRVVSNYTIRYTDRYDYRIHTLHFVASVFSLYTIVSHSIIITS